MLPEVKLPPPMEVASHGGSLGDLQRSVVGRPISKLRSKTSSFRCQLTPLRHRSLLQVGSIQIFEALDARIATALKKANSSLEFQENDLLGGAESST